MANDGNPRPSAGWPLKLFCQLVDDENKILGASFSVDTSSTAIVADLRDQIFAKYRNTFTTRGIDAIKLVLWKLLTALPIIEDDDEDAALTHLLPAFFRDPKSVAKHLIPGLSLSRYFNENPPKEHLHLIVQALFSDTANVSRGKRKRTESNDAGHIIERWRSKRVKSDLPTIAELARIIDLPLSDDEKIPIPVEDMRDLLSRRSETYDICKSEDVELLFQVGEGGPVSYDIFSIVHHAPPAGGTDKSFISFWDRNVRYILELLIPNGKSTRNSSGHTATESLRPDYAFLLNKLCAFRGEEEAPDSTDNPKAKLADKLVWAYSPAPYVLGYYATGPDFTLVAISPSQSQQHSRPVVTDIAHANLRLRKDRIKNICRLINLARLFESLADLVRPADAEFEVLERENCTVEIAGRCVIKVFTSPERAMHLQSIYSVLRSKEVPHVDSLVHHFNTTKVVLSPRGIADPPKTEKELLAALMCVLEALEALHKAPPVFHRDIRWPNVMRRLDDPQRWFIIDWDDAASVPTKALPHFNRSTHSPRVFVDEHGAEVDMWSVGELIVQCKASGISSVLQEMGKWMQGVTAPSAREALEKIKEYQLSQY